MYQLTGVAKRYRKRRRTVTAVQDLTLTIDDGEWLAVQGRTGHGKSTLLNLLGGLDRPTTGTVELDGTSLGALPETQLTQVRAHKVGFIFQTYNLIPTLSAAENVEAALIPLGTSQPRRDQQVAAALDAVGLADRADHLPTELSGGQQQRVAIARALVKDPTVVLADEPTGNLDEDTRDDIIVLLERLWRDRGLTLVLVTHDTTIARRAQRTAVMTNGHLAVHYAISTRVDRWMATELPNPSPPAALGSVSSACNRAPPTRAGPVAVAGDATVSGTLAVVIPEATAVSASTARAPRRTACLLTTRSRRARPGVPAVRAVRCGTRGPC
jgi:putative ABC transport system ATP-binding protein